MRVFHKIRLPGRVSSQDTTALQDEAVSPDEAVLSDVAASLYEAD